MRKIYMAEIVVAVGLLLAIAVAIYAKEKKSEPPKYEMTTQETKDLITAKFTYIQALSNYQAVATKIHDAHGWPKEVSFDGDNWVSATPPANQATPPPDKPKEDKKQEQKK